MTLPWPMTLRWLVVLLLAVSLSACSIVRKDGGVLLEIGGMPDHVHLLMRYHQKRAVADFMRDLKSNSSRWVHEAVPEARSFAWQDGYGAFTVSKSMESTVVRYIRRQPEHHREKSFKEEFRDLLAAHGVEWDEAYIWD